MNMNKYNLVKILLVVLLVIGFVVFYQLYTKVAEQARVQAVHGIQ